MDGLTEAIATGAADAVRVYGLAGFFLLCSFVVIVVLWRALREERQINKDLNANVVVELRNAINETAEMRRFYENLAPRRARQ